MRRREWERHDLVAGTFRDGQPRLVRETLPVPGQPMHGQEVDRRGDVLLAEGALVLVARRTGTLGIDTDDVEVQGVHVPLVARERRDPVELGNRLVVEPELPQPDLAMTFDLVELAERDRAEHVGEDRLVAGY